MKRIPLVLLILGLEITCVVLIYFYMSSLETDSIISQLNIYTDNIVGRFNYTTSILFYVARRTTFYFDINGKYMSESNFNVVANLITPYVLIPSTVFYWIPKIYNSELNYYNNYLNSSVLHGAYLSEVATLSPLIYKPVENRSIYYPLTLVNPINSVANKSIGLDYGTVPEFFDYIIELPFNESPILSTRMNSVISNGIESYSVFIYEVADSNTTGTIGYLLISVSIVDIINQAIAYQELTLSDLDIIIFDISTDTPTNESVLYKPVNYNANVENDLVLTPYSTRTNLTMLNKKWEINLLFANNYIKSKRTFVAESILISLIIFFLLLNIIALITNEYINKINTLRIMEEKKKNIANTMLGYVNHEIRNPLNGVVGLLNISTMSLSQLCDKKKEVKLSDIEHETTSIISDLTTANRSCDLITFIVNDILDIRKIEEGKLFFEISKINLTRFVADFKKTITTKLNEKPNLLCQISIFEENYIIMSDYKRLSQILLNLVSNSIKFTFDGGIRINIKKK